MDEQVPTAVKAKRDWGSVTAIIAALVGLLALGVSACTANLQRQQVRAQVWPFFLSEAMTAIRPSTFTTRAWGLGS